MSLGDNIFQLRKKEGFSQEQLGEKINVTRQTISNWELGETSPNPEQLKLLSNVLNVSIDDLLDNNIQNVIAEKINNTEKNTKSITKIVKYILIGFIILLFIDLLSFFYFYVNKIGPFENIKNESSNFNINYNGSRY